MGVDANWRFLVNRRGQPATLRTVSGEPTYNPATGTLTETTLDYTVKAYFGQYMLGEGSNNEVSVGTRMVALSPVDTSGEALPTPNTNDKIMGVQDTVVVSEVQTIFNGTTPVVYICMVKE